MKKQPKRYQIKTISDFEQIPAEKLRHCLYDFELFLRYLRLIKEKAQVSSLPLEATGTYVWVDDAKHDFSARITIITKNEKRETLSENEVDLTPEIQEDIQQP